VVATVSINGGTIHNLTDPALDSQHPNWSPDSRKIVFTIHSENGTENIAIMNATELCRAGCESPWAPTQGHGRAVQTVSEDVTVSPIYEVCVPACLRPYGAWVQAQPVPRPG
jgi:hypothetical protein